MFAIMSLDNTVLLTADDMQDAFSLATIGSYIEILIVQNLDTMQEVMMNMGAVIETGTAPATPHAYSKYF